MMMKIALIICFGFSSWLIACIDACSSGQLNVPSPSNNTVDVASNESSSSWPLNDDWSPPTRMQPVKTTDVRMSPDHFCGHSLYWNFGEPFFGEEAGNRQLPPGSEILGKGPAEPGEFPFQARLTYRARPNDAICGATILSEKVLLTAAHCLKDFRAGLRKISDLYVYTGDYDRTRFESPEQFRQVTIFKIHEQYVSSNSEYDFCLLKLDEPLRWSKYVSPICLPMSCSDRCYRLNNTFYVSGWGHTEGDAGGVPPFLLQRALVPIIDNESCKKMPGIAVDPYQVTSNKFCAGMPDGSQDACPGDEGGPVSCVVNGYYTLVGVTSASDGCAKGYKAGIYSNICKVSTWIQNIIRSWK